MTFSRAWGALLAATVAVGCTKVGPMVDGGEAGGAGGSSGGAGGSAGGAGETGGASGGERISFVDRTSTVPDPASLQPVAAKVERQFTCDMGAIGQEWLASSVQAAPNEQLVIRPAAAPCEFHLMFRAGTALSPLSREPAGYLMTAARRFPSGLRLVCASEESHHGVPNSTLLRETDGVSVRCWASVTTAFSGSIVAVAGGTDWAAWVTGVREHPSRPGAYVLTWVRDFTFQVATMTDVGRPATDGVYETTLTWDGVKLTAEPAVKVSSVTNVLASAPVTGWEPTPQDVRDLSGFIDFSRLDGGP